MSRFDLQIESNQKHAIWKSKSNTGGFDDLVSHFTGNVCPTFQSIKWNDRRRVVSIPIDYFNKKNLWILDKVPCLETTIPATITLKNNSDKNQILKCIKNEETWLKSVETTLKVIFFSEIKDIWSIF